MPFFWRPCRLFCTAGGRTAVVTKIGKDWIVEVDGLYITRARLDRAKRIAELILDRDREVSRVRTL